MKIISWNLLRLTGARVEDLAALVERHHPDLLFLQEAIEEMADLPALVGGYFFREPLGGVDTYRIHKMMAARVTTAR